MACGLIRLAALSLLRPEALICGGLIALLASLGFSGTPSGVGAVGFASLWGPELYLILRKTAATCVFLRHAEEAALRDREGAWQQRFRRARCVLWPYNIIVALVCAAADFVALPVGGTPLLVPFHPHPRSFFLTMPNLRRYTGRPRVESQANQSVDRKDDIAIYNQACEAIFTRGSAELRR